MTQEDILRRAILNDEFPNADEFFKSDSMAQMVPDRLKFERNAALGAWMSRVSGREVNASAADWQANKDALVRGYFKDSSASNVSDEQLHSLVKTHIQTSEEAADMAANMALQGKTSFEALKEMNTKRGPSLVRPIWDRYTKDLVQRHSVLSQKLAPYRGIVDSAASKLGKTMQENLPASQDFRDVATQLLQVPEEDRHLVISAIGATGGATAEERASYLSKLAGAMGRMTETMGSAIASDVESASLAETVVSLQEAGQMDFARKMEKNIQGRQELNLLTQQIRQVADSEVSPIKGDNWWSQTGIDVARMAPQIAVTVANPMIGTAANLSYFRATVAAEAKQEDPSLTYQQADTIGALTAPFNAAIETVTALIPFGKIKLPFVQKWLSTTSTSVKGAARNLAIRGAFGVGAEVGEEMLQAVAPLWTQELLSALDKDMPVVDWEKRMPDFSKIAAQTWGPALVFGLVGGGAASINDIKQGRALASDRDVMVATGMAPAMADQIATAAEAGDWSKADSLFRQEFVSTTKATDEEKTAAVARIMEAQKAQDVFRSSSERGADELERAQTIEKAMAELARSRVFRDAEGWAVEDTDTNEVVRFDSREAAVEMAYSRLDDNAREEAIAMAKVLEAYSSGGDILELDLGKSMDLDETGETEAAMKEAAITEAMLNGMPREQAEKITWSVLGTNNLETVEGVRRVVAKLFQGAGVMDAIEEPIEGKFQAALEQGVFTSDEALNFVKIAAEAMRAPELVTTAQSSARGLVEAISDIVMADVFGQRKDGRKGVAGAVTAGLKARLRQKAELSGVESKFAAFLAAFRKLFKQVFKRSRALLKARKEGKLSGDFDEFLDTLMNVDPQRRHDAAAAKEAMEIAQAGNMAFSVETTEETQDDSQTEPGELAPDSDVESLPIEEGENIPWTEETSFSLAPQFLPTVFKPFNKEIKDKILSETKTIAAIHIDRMKVGEFAGVPLQGGMFYPSIVENLKKRIAWAFNADNIARGVARRAAQNGGYVKLVLMQEGNVIGNKTFGTIWFKQLEESIASKKISKAAALKELNRVRDLYAVHPKSEIATGHTKPWKTIDEAREAIINMPQKKRGATYFQKSKTKTIAEGEKIAYQALLSKKMTSLGFPDAIDIVSNIEESSFKGVPTGAVVGIVKFDPVPEDEKIQTATEAGVPEHLSYKYVLKGEPVARMMTHKVIDETFPNVAGKMLNQQHTNFEVEKSLSFSLTPKDTEYLAAVNSGDMAKAQEMVDEAAKKAGYDVGPVWHGSNSPFNIFDKKKAKAGRFGKGFYFTPNESSAKNYGEESVRVRGGELTLRRFYLKADAFNYKNAIYVAFDPSEIKSADPVTRDDNGNVIPLSQRFNTESSDIRFSLAPRSLPEVADTILAAQMKKPAFFEAFVTLARRKMDKLRKQVNMRVRPAYVDQSAEIQAEIESARVDYEADVEQLRQDRDFELAGARQEKSGKLTQEQIRRDFDGRIAQRQKDWIRQKAELDARLEANDASIDKDAARTEKERQMMALRTLDAILSAFPPEIRAKVGGFVKLAEHSTDKAREAEITRRLAKLEEVIEDEAKKHYAEKIEKLFKRFAPKKEAGKKATGQLDPDAQELVDAARAAMGYDDTRTRAELAAIDSMLAEDGITPEREIQLERQRELVQLFGDFDNAESTRLESAADALEDTATEGWAKWKLKKIMERERRVAARESLIADTGKPSIGKERDKQNKWAKTGFGKSFSALLNVSSFAELLRFEFGEKSATARKLEDQERAAAYAYEDAMQAFGDRVGDFFAELAGGRLAGEQLRFDLAQPTLTVGTGDNERSISQLQGIQALLMWQQEDGRRHMEGQLDESGKPSGKWHYGEAWVKDLESKLTPEAYQVKAFLEQLYAEEYQPLNAIYRQRHGVNLPKNERYSPITVQPMQAKAGEMVDPVSGFAVTGSILTPGGLRTRNKRAVAEPRFDDAVQIFLGHSRQMEHWKAYYDFATEAQAILLNREVTNAVEAKGSTQAVTVLKKWVDQFAQGGSRDAQAGLEISSVYSRASGRAARVALLGRISTILIQSGQLAAASVKMPVGSYLKRLGMLLSGNLDYTAAVKSPFIQRRYKTAPPIVQQALAGVGDAERPGVLSSVTPRILGNALSGADALFTGGTYAIILDYHRNVTGPAMGLQGAELEAFAQMEAERDTEAVAQPVRAGTRSIFENTLTSPLAKTGFAFASEARQKIALAAWAASRAKKDPAQAAKVAFLTFIVGGLVSQVLKNLWREAKDDDDEKMWSAERLVKATIAGPLHGVPGVSELVGDPGLFSGLAWSMGGVKKIATKAMEDDLDEVTMRDVENALSAAGYFNDTAAGIAGLSHAGFDFAKILQSLVNEDE